MDIENARAIALYELEVDVELDRVDDGVLSFPIEEPVDDALVNIVRIVFCYSILFYSILFCCEREERRGEVKEIESVFEGWCYSTSVSSSLCQIVNGYTTSVFTILANTPLHPWHD